jgi:hypothetical protein
MPLLIKGYGKGRLAPDMKKAARMGRLLMGPEARI